MILFDKSCFTFYIKNKLQQCTKSTFLEKGEFHVSSVH